MPDVNKYIMDGKYNQAIALAKKEIKQLPGWSTLEHWYLGQISSAYNEKTNYEKALEYADKAFKLEPKCVLGLWHLAVAHHNLRLYHSAIIVYCQILELGIRKALSWHGESRNKVLGIRSDCRLRIAECYYEISDCKQAKKWLNLFFRYYDSHGTGKKKDGKKLLIKIGKEQ